MPTRLAKLLFVAFWQVSAMSETWKGRPGTATETASTTDTTNSSSVPHDGMQDEPWISLFTRRVLADALLEASARYWERRAEVLEDAAPRLNEFHGRASRSELSASWQRCMADAARCRQHAALLRDRSVSAARAGWAACLDREVAA